MNDQSTVRLVVGLLGAGMIVALVTGAVRPTETAGNIASASVGALGALLANTRKEAT